MWSYNITDNQTELYHYGVKGVKWGVHKEEYKAMNRSQRKAQRKKYYETPEGKIDKAIRIGTVLGGVPGALIAGFIAAKRSNYFSNGSKKLKVDKKTVDKGKKKVDDFLNNETDEQKIMRLAKEGKIDLSKRDYLFDQYGKLFYVEFKD